LLYQQDRGFPLMVVAAGMFVLVMPVIMNMLMSMLCGIMAVFMPIMTMSHRFMRVLMLMFVLVMAAHGSSLLSLDLFNDKPCPAFCQHLPQ
jgi:hypothetical protein